MADDVVAAAINLGSSIQAAREEGEKIRRVPPACSRCICHAPWGGQNSPRWRCSAPLKKSRRSMGRSGGVRWLRPRSPSFPG